MNAVQSIAIMKALADESRLAMLNSLLERPQYVEELAKRHALAPSTVSFHLKKLEQAGLVQSRKEQYYVIIAANEQLLQTTLREIICSAPANKDLQDQRMEEYRRKVLTTFFKGGVLEKLPAQHKKRLIILEQFTLLFQPGHRYSEAEVTVLLRPLYDDYCTIRRLLVDERLIQRDATGYWRDPQDNKTNGKPMMNLEKSARQKSKRAQLKQEYKESRPEMGVFQIRNKANGKVYIGSSENLEAEKKSRLFQLKMGKVVFNRELQAELTEFGAASFEFGVLETLAEPDKSDHPKRALLAMKLKWQEQLQPFGAQGYNSRKGYEREQDNRGTVG